MDIILVLGFGMFLLSWFWVGYLVVENHVHE